MRTELKPSRYNHIVPYQNASYILFNANSKAMVVMSSEQKHFVENVLADVTHPETSLDKDQQECLDDLQARGFVVPASQNELNKISEDIAAARNNHDTLTLTLAPTLGCNFNCPYCFESEESRANFKTMSPETQSHLIAYTRNFIEQHQPKALIVTWFGGEPLLAMNAIGNLTRSFFLLAHEHKLFYDADIVTNGYKLTPTNIKRLIACRIRNVQVTIDGPEHIHNKRRIAKNNQGTYQILLSNIENAIAKGLAVNIRINVDQENFQSIDTLLDDLETRKISNKITLTLGYIYNGYDTAVEDKIEKLNRAKFSNIELHVKQRSDHLNAKIQKPKRRSHYCAADSHASLMMGPLGEIYQCWDDFGNTSKVLGNIRTKINRNLGYRNEYLEFDPSKHPKCSQCNVMPLCLGGCPKQRLEHNGEPQCERYKYNLADWLSAYAEQQATLV